MQASEAIQQLTGLLEELELAAEDNDWDDVALIDKDIVAIARQFPKEQRNAELAEQFVRVRAVYQDVLELSKERRGELQQKMSQMREKRGAIAGYKNSLAAGNREVRGIYDTA